MSREPISVRNMDREQWLALRQESIGSSDAGAVVGINPYKSALQVYMEKIGAETNNQDNDNIHTWLGRKMESIIAERFTIEVGVDVTEDAHIRFHSDHDFISCQVDRLIPEWGIPLEIKMHGRYAGNIPDYEYAQIQQQMAVMDVDEIAYCVFQFGFTKSLTWEKVKRDTSFVQKMIDEEQVFWNDHVLKRVPPEPQNLDDLKMLYMQSNPDSEMTADPALYQMIVDHAEVKKQIKELKELEKDYSFHVVDAVKHNETVLYEDIPVLTYKQSKDREYFNKSAFRDEYPEIYNKFVEMRPGSRRLLNKIKLSEDSDNGH